MVVATRPYVAVFPDDKGRRGWIVAVRHGDTITRTRLEASIHDPDAARTEAAAMYPDHLVWLPGDPKPWRS